MTTEAWVTILAALGAALLGLAAAAGLVHRLRPARRAHLGVAAGRAAAIIALAVATALAAMAYGSPSLFDVRLVALPLALAASTIHFALALTSGRLGGAWSVDALLAGLLSIMLAISAADGAAFGCDRRAPFFFIEWALYLLGSGALLVAGGTVVDTLVTRGKQSRVGGHGVHDLSIPALLLALVTLGAGLLVGTWWAWQATGTLLASDQRQVWMAVSWIVAGMALLAGELQERAERWLAGLAVAGASVAVFGLLVLPDLLRLWGG